VELTIQLTCHSLLKLETIWCENESQTNNIHKTVLSNFIFMLSSLTEEFRDVLGGTSWLLTSRRILTLVKFISKYNSNVHHHHQ
jgi:hypothetical protein